MRRESCLLTQCYRKKGGYEEAPDFFRIRDTDGSAVLCHNCQTAADTNRAIIPCSTCGLYWHLDCLDPPMAFPSVLRSWVCPAHVDVPLATEPGGLAPAHRHRKIRGAPAVAPAFTRGSRNNGFIDVVYDELRDQSGYREVKQFGRVLRLPAAGIILDVISQYV